MGLYNGQNGNGILERRFEMALSRGVSEDEVECVLIRVPLKRAGRSLFVTADGRDLYNVWVRTQDTKRVGAVFREIPNRRISECRRVWGLNR